MFLIDYLKYFFNKLTSSKYVRKGHCKRCGSCCRNILLYTVEDLPVVSEKQFEQIKAWNKHFRHFYISGKNENGALLFTCKELDENNRCKVYYFRGIGCWQYPKADIKFLINGGKMLDGCGYYFEPKVKFKEYFKE